MVKHHIKQEQVVDHSHHMMRGNHPPPPPRHNHGMREHAEIRHPYGHADQMAYEETYNGVHEYPKTSQQPPIPAVPQPRGQPIYLAKTQKDKIMEIIQGEIDKEIQLEMKALEQNDKQLQKTLYSLETLKLLCYSSRYDFDPNSYPIKRALESRAERFPGFAEEDLVTSSERFDPEEYQEKRICCGCDMDSTLKTQAPYSYPPPPETQQSPAPPPVQNYPPSPALPPSPMPPVKSEHAIVKSEAGYPPAVPATTLEKKTVKFIVGSASRNFPGKNELFVFVVHHKDSPVKPQEAIDRVKFELELDNGMICSPFVQSAPNDFLMTSTLSLPADQPPPTPPRFCRITMFFKLPDHNKTALCKVPLSIDYGVQVGTKIEGPKNVVETDLVFAVPAKQQPTPRTHGKQPKQSHTSSQAIKTPRGSNSMSGSAPGSPAYPYPPSDSSQQRSHYHRQPTKRPRFVGNYPHGSGHHLKQEYQGQNGSFPQSEASSYVGSMYGNDEHHHTPIGSFDDQMIKCEENHPGLYDLMQKLPSFQRWHRLSYDLYKTLPPGEYEERHLIDHMLTKIRIINPNPPQPPPPPPNVSAMLKNAGIEFSDSHNTTKEDHDEVDYDNFTNTDSPKTNEKWPSKSTIYKYQYPTYQDYELHLQAISKETYLSWPPAKRTSSLILQARIFQRALQYQFGISPYDPKPGSRSRRNRTSSYNDGGEHDTIDSMPDSAAHQISPVMTIRRIVKILTKQPLDV